MGTSRSNGDLSWVDPIIGLRTTWDLSDRVSTMVSGDISGFGVGSDFAWNVMGVAGYRFGLFAERDATVFAGYRALGQDYSKGSGANRTSWDMILHGPVVGMAVEF